MQITVLLFVAAAAFITAIANALGKCPAWVPLVLLSICALLSALPLR